VDPAICGAWLTAPLQQKDGSLAQFRSAGSCPKASPRFDPTEAQRQAAEILRAGEWKWCCRLAAAPVNPDRINRSPKYPQAVLRPLRVDIQLQQLEDAALTDATNGGEWSLRYSQLGWANGDPDFIMGNFLFSQGGANTTGQGGYPTTKLIAWSGPLGRSAITPSGSRSTSSFRSWLLGMCPACSVPGARSLRVQGGTGKACASGPIFSPSLTRFAGVSVGLVRPSSAKLTPPTVTVGTGVSTRPTEIQASELAALRLYHPYRVRVGIGRGVDHVVEGGGRLADDEGVDAVIAAVTFAGQAD
jgi:hypothetical protein